MQPNHRINELVMDLWPCVLWRVDTASDGNRQPARLLFIKPLPNEIRERSSDLLPMFLEPCVATLRALRVLAIMQELELDARGVL